MSDAMEIEIRENQTLVCTSCNTKITNQEGTVRFLCPNCGEFEIVRCGRCRRLGMKYKCPNCGFEGPN